jgi:hypothetical protein
MDANHKGNGRYVLAGVFAMAMLLGGCATVNSWYDGAAGWFSGGVKVTLSGANEVPPVATSASGQGTINVGSDKSVSGSVKTTCSACVAAHIHQGAAGKNGPVIVPLAKTSDGVWSVPAGAKFTDEQYTAYKAGGLYVNMHTPANKGGEIRGQLQP